MSTRRILIADDEPDIRELLYLVFKREGHHVQKAESGAMAIELLKAEQFDLVISDFWMGNGNGDQVLEFILQNSLGCALIFYSSDLELNFPPEGETFKGFVAKPYFRELMQKANQVLNMKQV